MRRGPSDEGGARRPARQSHTACPRAKEIRAPEKLINDVVHQGFVSNQNGCVQNAILGTNTGEKSGWMYALNNRKEKGDRAGDGEGSQRYDPDAAAYSFDYAQRKDMEQEDSVTKQRIRRAARILHAAALQGGSIVNGGCC